MKRLLYVSKFSGSPVTLMIVLVVVGVPTDGLIPVVSVVSVMQDMTTTFWPRCHESHCI